MRRRLQMQRHPRPKKSGNMLFKSLIQITYPQHPRNPYLLGREDGDVVLVYQASLLLNHVGVVRSLEVLARQPEEHVLLAVL